MSKSQRTCMRIVQATQKLLHTQTLDDIAVTDICRLSGLSRTTFYVYFDDVYAVPKWLWDNICEESLYRIGDGCSWKDGHIAFFQALEDNKAFFARVFEAWQYNSVREYGYRKSLEVHIHNVERRLNRALSEDELFVLDYTVRSFSAMTTKWVLEGMGASPKRMGELLDTFVPEFAQ